MVGRWSCSWSCRRVEAPRGRFRSAEARSRRSPTTPCCRTARSARSWRRAGTWSGCRCRGWMGPASSPRSSTATPAGSGPDRWIGRSRRPAATCRGRWSSRRHGARRRAGSRSTTRSSSGPGITTPSAPSATSGLRAITRPGTCWFASSAAWTAMSTWRWTAHPPSTTGARGGRGGTSERPTATRCATPAATRRRCACAPICASASRVPGHAPRRPSAPGSAPSARWAGASTRRQATTPRRGRGSRRRARTGTSGWAVAGSPTTPGRSTCSAPR